VANGPKFAIFWSPVGDNIYVQFFIFLQADATTYWLIVITNTKTQQTDKNNMMDSIVWDTTPCSPLK
jgi:hypothetical protein